MPSDIIRENHFCLQFSLPDIDWLEKYYRKLIDVYRSYALRPAEIPPICRLTVMGELNENIASLRIDTEEEQNGSLLVFRRLAQNWLLNERLLLRDKQLLKLANCSPLRPADGYYYRNGRLYAFRNHFHPGMEEGLRRSARRNFIEEIPLQQKLPH